MVANELRKNENVEVFEEAKSVADNGSTRRCDTIGAYSYRQFQ